MWDFLIREKGEGGLGIRDASIFNKALIMKLGWKIFARNEAIFEKFFRTRCNMSSKVFFGGSWERKQGSWGWRSLKWVMLALWNQCAWAIGNRTKARIEDP